ncbi:MAG: BrnA antitoxin family protein [Pseudomonadota bacterium]
MKEKNDGLKSNLRKVDRHIPGAADYAEIPELPDDFFTNGQIYRNGKPAERRSRGKQKVPVKKQLTIRLNSEVVDFFKAQGNGWQSRINTALLEYIKTHKHA